MKKMATLEPVLTGPYRVLMLDGSSYVVATPRTWNDYVAARKFADELGKSTMTVVVGTVSHEVAVIDAGNESDLEALLDALDRGDAAEASRIEAERA